MPVGISDILHVLAHELRTPVGIAHGYVRLLLEDRLPQEAERRRALEQMQRALGRLTNLSHESSALASWYEQAATDSVLIAVRDLLTHVEDADYESPVSMDLTGVTSEAMIATTNATGLADAIANLVRATARELRGASCEVRASVIEKRDAAAAHHASGNSHHKQLEVLVGQADLLTALAAGPQAADAGPITLERGGLGLALVHAAVVLDTHRAERWTVMGSRQTAGLRLPLEDRGDARETRAGR